MEPAFSGAGTGQARRSAAGFAATFGRLIRVRANSATAISDDYQRPNTASNPLFSTGSGTQTEPDARLRSISQLR